MQKHSADITYMVNRRDALPKDPAFQKYTNRLQSDILHATQMRGIAEQRINNLKAGSLIARTNSHLNPATRGAIAGVAVGGTALAAAHAVHERNMRIAKAKAGGKSITKAHAGKAGGSPSKTTKSNAKGGKGKKTNYKRGEHGRFAGSQ